MSSVHRSALLACALVLSCQSATTPRASPPAAEPLRCVPGGEFSAPDDNGVLVDVPDPSSRATVLEIWARWCRGCQGAVRALLEHRDGLEPEGIRVVLLGVLEEGETLADARATLLAWGVDRPFVVDLGGVLMRKFGFADLPASVVLDGRGNIRWSSTAESTVDDVVAAAREAAASSCQ